MSNDPYQYQNTWVYKQELRVLKQMQKDAEKAMYPKKETCDTAKKLMNLIQNKNDY